MCKNNLLCLAELAETVKQKKNPKTNPQKLEK